MGSQRPSGYSSGIWRQGTPKQLPAACVRGSNPRLRTLRRNLVCPSAAISIPETPANARPDSELRSSSAGSSASPSSSSDKPRPGEPQAATQHAHQHHHPQQAAQREQQRRLRQQQQHDAANQLVQRLVPPTPVASATKLPSRGGVGAGGVALGILLTVALQMVGRWLTRQRWGQQLLELLDLRRSSGSSASTSDRRDGDGDAAAGEGWRWLTGGGQGTADRGRGPASGAEGGGAAAAAAARTAAAGSAPGSPLASTDGPGAAAGGAVGLGATGVPGAAGGLPEPAALAPGSDPGETVEWVNMCWRKVWRVYQRGLERWIIDLLQPVFDGLVKDGAVPRWLCRLRVVELTLDHEAPYFSNMRRRNSRKDSDLNGVVDLRYTGGARMLLMLELGEGRWRFKVPVLVSDLDLECQMWLKLRLAPMCPWIGTISLAFVGPPNVKVQLSPYNRVRLMRVPVVQNYLRKLLTVDLPALMVLPQRLEINIPPSVTTIAEAAVGRDTIMRAVASAVLQADAVEAALLAALPLGPQTPAGGVSLPEAFKGELSVTLREARDLPVWGFPGQSNPYCRLVLGDQAVQSRREGDTSHPGSHRAPVWNQEFQFLVEDPAVQVLEMLVKDSHLTGRTEVGRVSIRLVDLMAAQHRAEGGKMAMWVPLQPPTSPYITGGEAVPTGEVLVELSYKPFDDDEQDSGYREAENYSKQAAAQTPITDIRSAAAASSRAAVAASAAVSAIAMTRAAAARAAARAARAAQEAAAAAAGAAKGAVDQGASMIGAGQQSSPGGAQPARSDAKQPAGGKGEGAAGAGSSAQAGGGLETAPAAAAMKEAKPAQSPERQQRKRIQQAQAEEQQQQQEVPLAAGAGAGRQQAAASVAAASEVVAEAVAVRRGGAADDDDDVHGVGNGAGNGNGNGGGVSPQLAAAMATVPSAAAAAAALRVRSGVPGGEVDGGGATDGSLRMDSQQGQGTLELSLEIRSRVLAEAHGGLSPPSSPPSAALAATAAAAASAAAVKAAAATATAVIERPPTAATGERLTFTGGGGDGVSYSHHLRDGNGDIAVLSGGNGGGGGATRGPSVGGRGAGYGAGEEPPATAAGHEGASAPFGMRPLPAGDDADQDEGPSAGSGRTSGTLPLLLREPHSMDPTHHLLELSGGGGGGLDGGRQWATSPRRTPQQAAGGPGAGAGAEAEVVDVAAAAVARREPAGGGGSSGPQPGGGGGGGGGAVLSALVSLGASAQSLTASAIDKAWESFGQKHQHPDHPQQTSQQPEAAEAKTVAEPVAGAGGVNWLEALVSRLPRYGGGSDRSHHHHPHGHDDEDGEGRPGPARAAGWSKDRAQAAAAAGSSQGSVDDEQPWWQFWVPKGGAAKLRDAADGSGKSDSEGGASSSSSSNGAVSADAGDGESGGRQEGATGSGARPWWQFWGDGGERDRDREGAEQGRRAGGEEGASEEVLMKPVEAIYIPPDLPLEEIAAEVARLKEDSWRERSDHVSNLWMKAVERNDRKWLMLAAFLLSVAVGLLTVVAWRLEQLEHLQAAAPQIAIMTMQAALQALEQHASGGGML